MIGEKTNFIGLDGFIWFMGVVEDRQDPYMIGRVKVRCFGHHTGNKTQLPTEDLPWAQVMLPVTSAGISGIGQSPIGLVEGSHVFGFFRDGEDRQEMVVMGSLPGYPTELGDPTKGFYSPIQSGSSSNYPRWKDQPDTSQLATMKDYSFYASPLTDLAKHSTQVFDESYIKGFQNIGTASFEGINLASAYVSKGGFSLFGFVTDLVSSFTGDIFSANNILGFDTTGLGQITKNISTPFVSAVDYVTDTANGILPSAKAFLKTNLGVSDKILESATFETISTGIGKLGTNIIMTELPEVTNLAKTGMSLVERGADGTFKLRIDSPQTLAKVYVDSAATDVVNAYNKAQARVESGLSAVEGVTSKVLDTSVLGYKPAGDLKEVIDRQSNIVNSINNEYKNIHAGGRDTVNELIQKDSITGITKGLIEDEHMDSHSQKALVSGDMGENIPQKGTTNKAGLAKLMNNFILGDKSSWSVPNIPYNEGTYPLKHVFETESGHTMIYDDNPGNESIIQRHTSGTKYEISADGTRVDTIVSDNIHAVTGSRYSIIREDDIISLDGRYKILVNLSGARGNNYDIVVGPGANVNVQCDSGDINLVSKDGRINMECSDDFNIKIGGDMAVKADGDITFNSDGKTTLKGDKIYLN